eukprot:Nk52_evm68s230 gene=Nk52_evmTU68s230
MTEDIDESRKVADLLPKKGKKRGKKTATTRDKIKVQGKPLAEASTDKKSSRKKKKKGKKIISSSKKSLEASFFAKCNERSKLSSFQLEGNRISDDAFAPRCKSALSTIGTVNDLEETSSSEGDRFSGESLESEPTQREKILAQQILAVGDCEIWNRGNLSFKDLETKMPLPAAELSVFSAKSNNDINASNMEIEEEISIAEENLAKLALTNSVTSNAIEQECIRWLNKPTMSPEEQAEFLKSYKGKRRQRYREAQFSGLKFPDLSKVKFAK